MLQIKKNISPRKLKKKLLKAGFIENCDYIKHADMFKIMDPSISIKIKDRNIKITLYLYKEVFNEFEVNLQMNFVIDTLFDLIQAGLIEKV